MEVDQNVVWKLNGPANALGGRFALQRMQTSADFGQGSTRHAPEGRGRSQGAPAYPEMIILLWEGYGVHMQSWPGCFSVFHPKTTRGTHPGVPSLRSLLPVKKGTGYTSRCAQAAFCLSLPKTERGYTSRCIQAALLGKK